MSKHLGKGRCRRTLSKIQKLKGASAVLDEHKPAAADSAVVHCFTRGASLAVSEFLFVFFLFFLSALRTDHADAETRRYHLF